MQNGTYQYTGRRTFVLHIFDMFSIPYKVDPICQLAFPYLAMTSLGHFASNSYNHKTRFFVRQIHPQCNGLGMLVVGEIAAFEFAPFCQSAK